MTRRLRVVHVTGGLDLGGQEKVLLELARRADRDRFDLRFISLTTRGIFADELESFGWRVTALNLTPGFHPGVSWKLANIFRTWGADVVHSHNDRPLIYAPAAARLAGDARTVHTKYGQGVRNSLRQNFLGAMASRLTNAFVCVSRDCSRLAVKQGVAAERVRIIHNGINLEPFASFEGSLDGPAVVVGRLVPNKDHVSILHAVAMIVRDLPNFRLVIAGDGPCAPELRDMVARLKLEKHVAFLGTVRDIPALLLRARMKILSSVTEGVSLALLEGMAAGLPVVATHVGGTPEVVWDNVTGLLVPPCAPAPLAVAMKRVWQEESLARRLGRQGRQRAQRYFDSRRMVASYEQLYLGSLSESMEANHHVAWIDDDTDNGGRGDTGHGMARTASLDGPAFDPSAIENVAP